MNNESDNNGDKKIVFSQNKNIKHKCDTVEPGMVFGELTVLYDDFEEEERRLREGYVSNKKMFLCQCSCGAKCTSNVYQLLRGRKKSCGHLKKEIRVNHSKDLNGMTFGHLTVIKKDENSPGKCGKHTYWICKCNLCGNEKSIRSSDLLSGKNDCGCQFATKSSIHNAIDLSGKIFGHLHVKERDAEKGIKCGQHAYWVCECDLCGRTESVSSTMLIHYGKDRCKICMGISNGERKIIELLEENHIPFIHDKPYLDCRIPNSHGVLRFDFRITQNSECDYIIEFDGQQHFKDIPLYNTVLSLEDRIKYDQYKNDWCCSRGIPIIRIPYTHLKKLCIDDLLIETSKYVVNIDE